MAMAMAMDGQSKFDNNIDSEPEAEKKPIKEVHPKNHKEFFYGKHSVWALSQKRADKKAFDKGYLGIAKGHIYL